MSKISIIIPTLSNGGAERVASNFTFDFQEIYETHLILFENKFTYPYVGKCTCIEVPSTNSFFKKIINVFKRISRVRKIKKHEKFSCSISLLNGPNYINIKSKTKEEKTIVSVRNIMSESNLSKFDIYMLKRSMKKADGVVALSETVRMDLIKNYGANAKKVFTIYNSCDGVRLKQLSTIDNLNPFSKYDYIVTMGRLFKQKGQWHLIRSMVDVVKVLPNIKLIILGQGEETFKEKMINLSKQLHIESNIIFAGYINNPHKIIAESKLFVFSSLYEGLGNVLLEALACGKAIISTDCIAGPREILAPNTDFRITIDKSLNDIEFAKYGVLVPAFDNVVDIDNINLTNKEHLLAQAIIKLIQDKCLLKKYEENALIRIKDFSKENINAQWISLINQLINEEK